MVRNMSSTIPTVWFQWRATTCMTITIIETTWDNFWILSNSLLNVARDIQFGMPGKANDEWKEPAKRMHSFAKYVCKAVSTCILPLNSSFQLVPLYHWRQSVPNWCNLEWLCTSPLCKLIGCIHHFLCGDILVAKMCRYRHQRFDALRVRPIQGQDWRWAIGQGGILALYPKYWWNTPRSQLLGMERVLIQFHARGPLKWIVSLWKTGALCDNVWHVLLSFCRSFILLKCYLLLCCT